MSTNQNGPGGATNTVIRGLTASKERLMPDSILVPADTRKIGASREPVRLGEILPEVLCEIHHRRDAR